ncbi:hypothetical protein D6855_06820 [Butyrivibrio sp. CB08]|uniref:glycerophosphodiester phosphodiesterase family protein n=1 Tax=Butyrivibrio sp. CB08 TaxID=2364879 RepID=UPI000EA9AA6B|nr:glycerophosphodiester phosphodiesterase family protein [Butyrivibrio sp. CB08]RKM60426.1 hypothetical protein D6855_06820 [Butyrivibrio sp. CB08]
MRIWAHRGCSQLYPENTITSFSQAMDVPGVAGIELDIQLTRDEELVVIHDERVDRTTDGFGYVRDFTLAGIRSLHVPAGGGATEYIPTMREVFELMESRLLEYCRSKQEGGPESGMRLNIELKNSVYPYPGMEEKIVEMVHEFGVEDAIVYSSFYAESLLKVHELDPKAELGVLDSKVSDCLFKAIGLEQIIGDPSFKFALHPYGNSIDIEDYRFEGRAVRGWFGGHLYPEKPTDGKMDVFKYEALGVTDLFLNEPEKYCG